MSLQVTVVEPPANLESEHETGVDICAELKCGQGERCMIVDGTAKCECNDVCDSPKDERQKVFF